MDNGQYKRTADSEAGLHKFEVYETETPPCKLQIYPEKFEKVTVERPSPRRVKE
jgi:hypothetical protein